MENINSDINIIGGIPDFNLIEVALGLYAQGKGKLDLKELLVTNNAFDFRTESTRKKFFGAMHRTIFEFWNDEHKKLIEALFVHKGLETVKHRAVFWQLLTGNELFRIISKEVYAKVYFSGRTTIEGVEIFAFLKDLQQSNEKLKSFSDSTIEMIASKYLTILKKLGMVEGTVKKRILNIRLTESELLYFTYLCRAIEPEVADLFRSSLREFFFMEKTELLHALKNIKFMPLLDLASTGETLIVTLKKTPQELIDVISD